MPPITAPKVYVLILNWNGWKDTVECLESVYHNNYPNFQVIVCDNDSSDNSLELIKDWANGVTQPPTNEISNPNHLAMPPIAKPISYLEIGAQTLSDPTVPQHHNIPLILIQTGGNLGFAGGNNVGLRYALSQEDCAYVWLLNNDTVIEEAALSNLVSQFSSVENAGICGSTLRYYHNPKIIQALGGATYNKWTGLSSEIGNGLPWETKTPYQNIVNNLSYVSGASMLVSKDFLLNIGLMCEEYFLYFEELDWALRARSKYLLTFAPNSIVYHKEGASIGSGKSVKRSVVAEFYSFKNRLVVTRKFFPCALPSVMTVAWLQVTKRLINRQWSRARLMAMILLGLQRLPPLK
jgi:hypothetical protein